MPPPITNSLPRIKITPPSPKNAQESLFRAVQTAERAYLDHQAIAHAKGSALLLNLLKVHGQLVTDVKDLKPDDVIVVHRKQFDHPYREAHGFIGHLFDVMDTSYALVTYEVIAEPRNPKSFHKYASMPTRFYPEMGIYSSPNLYKESSIAQLIEMQVIYKVNLTADQIESAIRELVNHLRRPDGHLFYGKAYDCNVFLYDVLRRFYR